MCEMTHSYGPWLINMCHDSFVLFACRINLAAKAIDSLWNVCHDSFICAMTHAYNHDSFVYAVSIRQSPSVGSPESVCHDSSIWAMTYLDAPWLIHMCHDSLIYAMSIQSAAFAKCPFGRHPRSTSLLACTRTHTLGSSTCAMTHLYVPWLIHWYHVKSFGRWPLQSAPWLVHTCYDSFICAMIHASCVCAPHDVWAT